MTVQNKRQPKPSGGSGWRLRVASTPALVGPARSVGPVGAFRVARVRVGVFRYDAL